MISEATIEKLKYPISENSLCGTDIRNNFKYQGNYFDLKDARSQARQHERRFSLEDESKFHTPIWDTVFNQSLNLLENATKDIEITVWLIESLLRKYQFKGLDQGFQLLTYLVETYWKNILPRPDDDGYVSMLYPIINLNGGDHESTITEPLANIIITQTNNGCDIAMWQYQNHLKNKDSSSTINMETINSAINNSPTIFYDELIKDIESCIMNFLKLTKKIDELCNDETILPSSNVKNSLKDFLNTIKILAEDRNTTPRSNKKTSTTNTNKTTPLLNDRALALQKIDDIARYFKVHEPQSPIPYLLARAKQWSNLSLRDLIKEIINDDTQVRRAFEMTGIEDDKTSTF